MATMSSGELEASSSGVAPTSSSGEAGSTSGSPGGTSSGEVASTSTPVGSTSSTGEVSGDTSGGSPVEPIVVKNPGFEEDPVADGTYTDSIVPAGWMKYDPDSIIGLDYNSLGVLNPTGTVLYPDGAPEGSNVALVFLWRDQTSGSPAGYVQVLAAALQASTEYTLRVKVGNIAPEVMAPYDLAGFPGYRVELLAGGAVLAADDDTLAPLDGEFVQSEVVFASKADDAELGMPLAIRLINKNQADSGIEVNFDDVELIAAPAP